MNEIIEYIMTNYTWFLGGAIIVLLAIIGSYADKTNFGQGKQKNESEENINPLYDKNIDNYINNQALNENIETTTNNLSDNSLDLNTKVKDEVINGNKENPNENLNSSTLNSNKEDSNEILNKENNREIFNKTNTFLEVDNKKENEDLKNKNIQNQEQKVDVPENKELEFEETFDKFDEEFNSILPKKDVIDGALLEDIENLSLDKTQKFNSSEIPDLDDVELPNIKKPRIEDENIWKF